MAVGGCLFSRTPMALVRELLRQRRRGLTLARNLTCTEGESLMVAGAVARIVTAWMSIGLPWGVSKILRHFVESGRVAFEEWSHLALGLRFRAAAMGVPFLPTLTMLGSDLMEVGGMKRLQDPYTGATLAAVPALFPDVAMLHVHRADVFGNCQIDGYPHMDADIARAATTVLVTTEEIVGEEETRRRPERTVIPGFVVDALVLAPLARSPTSATASTRRTSTTSRTTPGRSTRAGRTPWPITSSATPTPLPRGATTSTSSAASGSRSSSAGRAS